MGFMLSGMTDFTRRETIEIGSTPYNEDCAQLGTEGYELRARVECRAFKHQLLRMAKEAKRDVPPDVRFFVKANRHHDYGVYYELAVSFLDEDDREDARDFALWIEGNLPEHWDAEARAELGIVEEVAT